MNDHGRWLFDLGKTTTAVDGLVAVSGYIREGRSPEEVVMMEKAAIYGAHSVFFEAGRNGRPPIAQAFVFLSDGPHDDSGFAELHKRLWSWGGVPLIYRKVAGMVQLFRCAHKPDFVSAKGDIVCKPIRTLKTAAAIGGSEAWWDASRLRNGTIWDDTEVCSTMLSASKAAHKRLIDAVRRLNDDLNNEGVLKKHLRRKLLILSLLIAYLEERGVFQKDYFGRFLTGATKFFQVLANGEALVNLLLALEDRFNGHVFIIEENDRETLKSSTQLARFARLVEGRTEASGQLTLWQLYSFKDLPVELISHIYQLFVKDNESSVYTPPFLVRLMLEEALSWERLDRLHSRNEIILDPSCGSGVFLVEAYKRLVLHWRSRNSWNRPGIPVLLTLLQKVHGIDLEDGAVELAAFSLCLALCDALEPEEIRASIRLFPPLSGNTIHQSCFFEAIERKLLTAAVGVVVGNPPFASSLSTPGAERSYQNYKVNHGPLPDKQVAYLFLHEAMGLVAEGGVLSMLQQYGFLYNKLSVGFRRDFIDRWDVREVLDFVSVRGLFQKAGADTKVVVVVADASAPKADRQILHATFRRSGRIDAEQGFDIDYYDLHWLPRPLALSNDGVWRSGLLGGGRVLGFVDRLKSFRTLGQFAEEHGWDFGEGFIEGVKKKRGKSHRADHIIGESVLPSEALTLDGIDTSAITKMPEKPIEKQRSAKRFTPPMLLVREQMDLPHAVWSKDYLTYKNQIVGFAASKEQHTTLQQLDEWLSTESSPLRAFVACVSVKLFTQKATTLSGADILALPYPENASLDLSVNERIIVDDIVEYQRDLVRLGEDSPVMRNSGHSNLPAFNSTFIGQINTVYRKRPLQPLEPQSWPGVICQPFVFGQGLVDWEGADGLKGKLNNLLHEQLGTTLHVTRIARIYDGHFVFLLKPDRMRYWLRSVALRDADEILADLRQQGF
ncbi:N-6 DNA Methylase [Singulisphaera sp. GP187]|uniref:HsdM family class I SAM-dependent methyltransferase n=1 Tax=Singulisphaera sp. GP187 TaxID=1882752 RepID=UPI00092CB0C7|nr:N-6 DNA methylase [Singulisphaera sp. GP187]SIO55733.1 N-6 DNA Methylase [Singulisphaera sp. GP187]